MFCCCRSAEKGKNMSKKWLQMLSLVLTVVLVVLFCACCAAQPEQTPSTTGSTKPTQSTTPSQTTVPSTTQTPTQAPTQSATEPQLESRNPFTGELQAEPFTARPFFISLNNNKNALPFCGINEADIVFEMLINSRSTRCFALVTDVSAIERFGSIRSLRCNFVDIAHAYDGIVVYAGGSTQALEDLKTTGVNHINALAGKHGGAFYREQGRLDAGYAREHTLFAIPSLMAQYAQKLGYAVTTQGQVDYGFRFTEDGTPADGETANTITMSFFTGNKQTTMKYDAAAQRYQLHQYGADQIDGNTNEPVMFRNVFTLFAVTENVGVYHIADLMGSGEGYYACGGKIVPIKWYHETEDAPFTFTLADGTPLEQSVGNSYVGIIPTGSAFTYE